MSGLFNLRVNGTAAEDIFCNGQAVEEVWVNGTQVFDAYDPQAVPNGTLSFSEVRANLPANYASASSTYTQTQSSGQIGATGYIELRVDTPSIHYSLSRDDQSSTWTTDQFYSSSSGNRINVSYDTYTTLEVPGFFSINIYSRPANNNHYDEVWAGGEQIISDGARYNGSKYARVEWNFKTRKIKVSGTNFTTVTKDFNQKWRAGLGVRLTHYGSNERSGWYVRHNGSYVQSYNVYTQAYVGASAGN